MHVVPSTAAASGLCLAAKYGTAWFNPASAIAPANATYTTAAASAPRCSGPRRRAARTEAPNETRMIRRLELAVWRTSATIESRRLARGPSRFTGTTVSRVWRSSGLIRRPGGCAPNPSILRESIEACQYPPIAYGCSIPYLVGTCPRPIAESRKQSMSRSRQSCEVRDRGHASLQWVGDRWRGEAAGRNENVRECFLSAMADIIRAGAATAGPSGLRRFVCVDLRARPAAAGLSRAPGAAARAPASSSARVPVKAGGQRGRSTGSKPTQTRAVLALRRTGSGRVRHRCERRLLHAAGVPACRPIRPGLSLRALAEEHLVSLPPSGAQRYRERHAHSD